MCQRTFRAHSESGRAFIGQLPPAVAAQAAVLLRLLEAAEADDRIRALQLRGSVARGTADEHSDLDTLLRVADEAYDAALADLPSFARSLGQTLDILFETPGSPYLFVREPSGRMIGARSGFYSRAWLEERTWQPGEQETTAMFVEDYTLVDQLELEAGDVVQVDD